MPQDAPARRTAKGAGIIGCGVLLLAVIFFAPGLFLGIALIGGSQRTVYQRAVSPDGWHEARVQFDDGGAVSGFDRIVLVKHRWNLSDEPLLSCRAFLADGEAPVHLRWPNSSTLLVEHGFAAADAEDVARHCGPIRIVTRQLPEAQR